MRRLVVVLIGVSAVLTLASVIAIFALARSSQADALMIQQDLTHLQTQVAALPTALTTPSGPSTLHGLLLVQGDPATTYRVTGETCVGSEEYADVQPGLVITVLDGNRAPLGQTSLGAGLPTGGSCQFPFDLTVPDAPFYTVVIGARGGVTYARGELVDREWAIKLALGDAAQPQPQPV